MGCGSSNESTSANPLRKTIQEKVFDLQAQIHKEIVQTNQDAQSSNTALVNSAIHYAWPYITEFAMKMIRQEVEPSVNAALPDKLGDFVLDKDNGALGKDPVGITNIVLHKEKQIGLNQQTLESLSFSASMAWSANCSLDFKVGSLHMRLNKIIVAGDLTLKLVGLHSDIPLCRGARMFFANPPDIFFDIDGGQSGGKKSMVLASLVNSGLVKRRILHVVQRSICNLLVLPNSLGFALVPDTNVFDITQPAPEGLLRLSVWKCENLKGLDIHMFGKSTSDPYVQVRCGALVYVSQTVKKTVNPNFNFHVPLSISAGQQQVVSIEVFDHDHASQDDFLGSLTLPVSDLQRLAAEGNPQRDYDLLDTQGLCGENGTITVGAVWAPTHQDNSRTSLHAMCVVSVGLHSANRVHCRPNAKAWVEVSCTNVIPGWPKGPLATPHVADNQTTFDANIETQKIQHKIEVMRKHGVPDQDIAEVLDMTVDRLSKYEKGGKNDGRAPRQFTWNKGFEFLLEGAEKTVVTLELKSKGLVADPAKPAKLVDKVTSHGKYEVQLSKFANDPLQTIVETVTFPKREKLKLRLQLRFFDTPAHATAADWIKVAKANGHADWVQSTQIDGDLDAFLDPKNMEWDAKAHEVVLNIDEETRPSVASEGTAARKKAKAKKKPAHANAQDYLVKDATRPKLPNPGSTHSAPH